LKHYGYVAAYWSLSYVIKYGTNFIKQINPLINQSQDVSTTALVFYVIIYFAIVVVSDVIPIIIALDNQFIKISTFDFVYLWDKEQEELGDLEKHLALHGQQKQLNANMSTSLDRGEEGLDEEIKMVSDL
jgi:hypothetical protein